MLRTLPLLLLLLARSAPADELPAEARAAWTQLAEVHSLRGTYVQTAAIPLLSQPVESRGSLAFSRPDRLVWRTETPAPSVFVMDGTRVGVAWPELGVKEQVDLASRPEWLRVVRAMMVWMAGDLDQVSQDYRVTWRASTPPVAVLEPRDETLARMFSRLELTFAGEPLAVTSLVLSAPDGAVFTYQFSSLEPNVELPAATFALP